MYKFLATLALALAIEIGVLLAKLGLEKKYAKPNQRK